MTTNDCRAAVLISGSGTNLQSFIDRAQSGELNLDLALVISNRPQAFGLVRASKAGINSHCVDHQTFDDRESFDRAVAAEIDQFAVNLIILAGFMRIVSPWFVNHYQGRILNIHPALLPAYPGLDTHQRVLDANERWHGSTVHFVTDELDGGPRIIQGRIPLRADDTAAELRKHVQSVEHQIYPQAASWYAAGRLAYRDSSAWLDGKQLAEPIVIDFP